MIISNILISEDFFLPFYLLNLTIQAAIENEIKVFMMIVEEIKCIQLNRDLIAFTNYFKEVCKKDDDDIKLFFYLFYQYVAKFWVVLYNMACWNQSFIDNQEEKLLVLKNLLEVKNTIYINMVNENNALGNAITTNRLLVEAQLLAEILNLDSQIIQLENEIGYSYFGNYMFIELNQISPVHIITGFYFVINVYITFNFLSTQLPVAIAILNG